jgi:hypothetical protein
MRLRIALVSVAFFALLASGVDKASAASVGILNAGFDDPSLALPNGTTGAKGAWAPSIIDWVTSGSSGTFAPFTDGEAYSGLGDLGRVAFMNSGGVIQQALGGVFQAGTDYLLSFDVGDRLDIGFGGKVELFDSSFSTLVATLILNDPGNGQFGTQVSTISASAVSAAGVVGQGIGIRFTATAGQVNVDNVSLSALPVPSAFVLFVSGFGILGWAARRHKHHADA